VLVCVMLAVSSFSAVAGISRCRPFLHFPNGSVAPQELEFTGEYGRVSNSFIYHKTWDGCEREDMGVYHAFTEYQAFEACMLNGFATEHFKSSPGEELRQESLDMCKVQQIMNAFKEILGDKYMQQIIESVSCIDAFIHDTTTASAVILPRSPGAYQQRDSEGESMTNDVVHDQQNNEAVSPLVEAFGDAPDDVEGDGEKGLETLEGVDDALEAEVTAEAGGLAGGAAEGSGEGAEENQYDSKELKAGGYNSVEAEAESSEKEAVGIELNEFDVTEMNSAEKDEAEGMEDELTELDITETEETQGLTEDNETEGASEAGEDNVVEDLAKDDAETDADKEGEETPAEEDLETPAEEDLETPAEEDLDTPAEEDLETPAEEDLETASDGDLETPAEDDLDTPASGDLETDSNPDAAATEGESGAADGKVGGYEGEEAEAASTEGPLDDMTRRRRRRRRQRRLRRV